MKIKDEDSLTTATDAYRMKTSDWNEDKELKPTTSKPMNSFLSSGFNDKVDSESSEGLKTSS